MCKLTYAWKHVVMFKSREDLLDEIKRDVLDEYIMLDSILKKAIALGRKARSSQLRDFAARELNGYSTSDDLPDYRHIDADVLVDGLNWRGDRRTGEQLVLGALPQPLVKQFDRRVRLTQGARRLAVLVGPRSPGFRTPLPRSQDIVRKMTYNYETSGVVHDLYLFVSHEHVDAVFSGARAKLASLAHSL